MRASRILPLLLFSLVFGVFLHASPIVSYQVTTLNAAQGQYRYTYFVSGVDLLKNEELDIRFSAQNYSNLHNGKADASPSGINGADFDLALFNPNSPIGSDGDYSALATVDHPSFAGTFSVDFTYSGANLPGVQSFYLYDDSGPRSSQICPGGVHACPPGTTAPLVVAVAPEPPNLGTSAFGFLALILGATLQRRFRH